MQRRDILFGIIAIIFIVGIVAFLTKPRFSNTNNNVAVLNTNESDNTILGTSTNSASWETYKIDSLNLNFKKPSDWTVNTSQGTDGSFNLVIKSPTNFTILGTAPVSGVSNICQTDSNTDLGKEKISILNSDYNIFYYGDKTTNTISYSYILKGDSPCSNMPYFQIPQQLTTTLPISGNPMATIRMFYPGQSNTNMDTFKSSSDMQIAKQILTSFSTQ